MPTAKTRRSVVYLHHSRDSDGDVLIYFLDRERGGDELMQSSPVVSIRRCRSAVLDRQGHGSLCRYIVTTQHTEYEVQLPRDKADHLATELGGFLFDPLGPDEGG